MIEKVGSMVDVTTDKNEEGKQKKGALPVWFKTAFSGTPESLASLLDAGADMGARDRQGRTALHHAVMSSKIDNAVFLLEKGIEINVSDLGDETPLNLACRLGNDEATAMLVGKKAELEAKNDVQYTPLATASKFNHAGIVKMLAIAGADIEAQNGTGSTPILLAASNGATESVSVLLGLGAIADFANQKGATPLYAAVLHKHMKIADMLLIAGADPNRTPNISGTLLDIAISENDFEMADLLAKHGAKVDRTMEKAVLIFCRYMLKNDFESAKKAMTYIPNVNSAGKEGDTALHYCARHGLIGGIKFLMENGADANALDCKGFTPIDYAEIGGREEAQKLLATHGSKPSGKAADYIFGYHGLERKGEQKERAVQQTKNKATPQEKFPTFADYAGMEDVKAKLRSLLAVKSLNKGQLEVAEKFGITWGGGILLHGAPGCGKTFLAKVVAGELKIPLLYIRLTDFEDPYVGVSERNIAAIFKEARECSPCVLFFDELDSFCGKRGIERHSYARKLTNTLLVEMDGAHANNSGILIMGATNELGLIDSALLRGGRFSHKIAVGAPDVAARKGVFEANMKSVPCESGLDFSGFAKATDGFSCAQIAHVCNEAKRMVVERMVADGKDAKMTRELLEMALNAVKPDLQAWFADHPEFAEKGDNGGNMSHYR